MSRSLCHGVAHPSSHNQINGNRIQIVMLLAFLFAEFLIQYPAFAQINTRPDHTNEDLRLKAGQRSVIQIQQLRAFSMATARRITLSQGAYFSGTVRKKGDRTSSVSSAPHEIYRISAFTAGQWTPQGNNSILGPHAFIGVMSGRWSGNWLIDMDLEFRFGQAANEYDVVYYGSTVTTKAYFGGFMGVHLGHTLMSFKSAVLYAKAGLGLDGFDSYYNNDDQDGVSINVLNKNIGLGYQHFSQKGVMWGLEMSYDFINYQNPGGSPLDGNALTVRLLIGATQ